MNQFTDIENSIDWQIYPPNEVIRKFYEEESFREAFQQLNNWVSDDIQEYITHWPELKLGDFIYKNMKKDYILRHDGYYLLFAHENEQMLGVVILNTNSKNISTDLKYYNNQPNLKIEYIIVDPNMKNMGIATRMIKSITTNQNIFTSGNPSNGVTADIDNENEPSKRVFLKNNFKIVMPVSYLNNYFSRYYHITKIPNKENKL